MVQKPLSGWRLAALNIFIAVHVLGLVLWGMPDSPFRNTVASPYDKYYVYSGLWHTWTMFAPTPLHTHFDLRAKVKYSDGSVQEWIAPRMEELSIWERTPKERYRKWREKVRTDDYRAIWPETARFIARQMNRTPNNPPVEVKLARYWVEMPRPKPHSDFQPMPKFYTPTNSFVYTTVAIRPEDLK